MERKSIDYQLVSNDDDDGVQQDDSVQRLPPSTKAAKIARCVAACIVLIMTATAGVALGSFHPLPSLWRQPKTTHAIDCGETSSSAMAAGCVMEPLTYGWMSPECMIPEVTNLHKPFRDIAWYEDRNLTTRVTEERLMRGEVMQIWTGDPNYHLQHCLFLMRKLYYAMDNRVEWIDTKATNAEHVYHCVGQLEGLAEGEQGRTLTNVNLGFYGCEKAPWYR